MKILKRFLKGAAIATLGMLAIVIIIGIILFCNHKMRCEKEKALLEPLGQIVEVNGHNISIYTEGSGEKTLVFLQGGAYPSPILEAKSLYSLLSDTYRIVVLERPGYGFSEEIDGFLSLDALIDLEREALSKIGIEYPFILVPHSASGIEAILWAQKYPNEIEAIIGLDMSVPAYYEALYDLDAMRVAQGENTLSVDITLFFYNTFGLTRFMAIEELLDSFKTGTLTDEDKEIYKALAYRIYPNRTMMLGMLSLPDDLELINSMPKPSVPMLLFVSNGDELMLDNAEAWSQMQKDYISDNTQARIIQLDCGHSMHNIEYAYISEEIRTFLNELDYKERQ